MSASPKRNDALADPIGHVQLGRLCAGCDGDRELGARDCPTCDGTGELTWLLTLDEFRVLTGTHPPRERRFLRPT